MPRLKRFAWLVLLPAVLAMVLVACGGDDDDDADDTSGAGDATATATEERTEDNGNDSANDDSDDDKDSGSSGGSLPSGKDERYVTDVCNAFNTYLTNLSNVFLELDPEKIAEDPEKFEDPEALFKPFIEGLEKARDELKQADPPDDIREWHEAMVQAFDQMIEGMRGNSDYLPDDFDVPEMPAKAQERLGRIAEKNEACQRLEEEGASIFESFGGEAE